MEESLQFLLDKHLAGRCTDEETDILLSHFRLTENEFLLKQLIRQKLEKGPAVEIEVPDLDKRFEVISENLDRFIISERKISSRLVRRKWYMVAAAVFVFFVIGEYLFVRNSKVPLGADITLIKNDIPPGTNKAVLTLANGKKVLLTDASAGIIAHEQQAIIQKTSDGQISYQALGKVRDQAPTYNTVTTPMGGQYRLLLADGTLAVLDAASSIKYPVAFTSKSRDVEITGQVYFEVVHNEAQPFRVHVNDMTVEDIGTKFNINAYDDEPVINTTLVEGAVKVSARGFYQLLNPGERLDYADGKMRKSQADILGAIAWKNGNFRFYNNDIQSVMRQISRWYNIDVRYAGGITTDGFNGKISRSKNISEVLQLLESTKLVHFKVEGKEVTVMP